MNRPKTIFSDLDGTLVKHCGDINLLCDPNYELEVLSGVREFLSKIDLLGYHLVITTGRKESMRKATVSQLSRAGIIYDQLIMGFGGGDRIILNDRKPGSDRNTVFAINVNRNGGLDDVEI